MKSSLIAAACVLSGAVVFGQFPKPPDPTKINPPATNNLSVSVNGNGAGVVTSGPPAITCPGPSCNANFLANLTVVLTAAPRPDSIFTGWGGACGGTGACSVSMNAQRNVTATFIKPTLSYSKGGDGGGTITSSPAGLNDCTGNCSSAFLPNTQVTVMATNGTGIFTGWSGNCTTGDPNGCTVTMSNNRSVTATFTRPVLRVAITGEGTVTGAGINCGSDCQESVNRGSAVALTATPAPGRYFAGWGVACSGTNPSCSVNMNAAEKNVQAIFKSPSIQVTKEGSGASIGTVTSNPTGIACGTSCGPRGYGMNEGVALTASVPAAPNDTAAFTGWNGSGCNGTGACNITTTGEHKVTATFVRRYELALKVAGNGSVSSDAPNTGVNCSATSGAAGCVRRFNTGTNVVLRANVPAGGQFIRWDGVCANAGTNLTCTVAMTADRGAAAVFR